MDEEQKKPKKKRFACLTRTQQRRFDELNPQQQKYVLYRASGNIRKDAYLMAGFQSDPKYANQAAYHMEKDRKIEDIIEALKGEMAAKEAVQEGTKFSKKIDAKAEQMPAELEGVFSKVDEDCDVVTKAPIDPAKISQADAMNAQFYRRVADGYIKSKKITTTYSPDGRMIARKVEETTDVNARMRAHEKYCQMMGLGSFVQVGSINAGDIKVLIVDASLKSEAEDKSNAVELSASEYEDKTDDGGK